jgi:cystathionine beta-lyase/cystathionine gamma-synthase
MNHLPLSLDELRTLLRTLLAEPGNVPDDWEPAATTYDLPRFCGEPDFLERFHGAARQILDGHDARSALYAIGIPYDYARLGSPFSTIYELYLRLLTGADRVVSFASRTKAFLAPLEVVGRTQPARVYCRGELPLSDTTRALWHRRNVTFHDNWLGELPADDPNILTLFVADTAPENTPLADLSADAISCPVTDGGVLLIRRGDRFDAKAIQLIRKRTVAALLAVTSKAELTRLVGLDVPASPSATPDECDAALAKSLPAVNGAAYFCTGLAAEAAIFGAAAELVSTGAPVPLFYAENGYGGTGQLIHDILSAEGVIAASPLRVMGDGGETFVGHVVDQLEKMTDGPALVFVETPTNPQLQVHDFDRLVKGLKAYQARTGQQIPVLVDTTMAPLYPLFEKDFAADWPFLIVKSGSKYITRGKATMGLVLAGAHPMAQRILEGTRAHGRAADSFAKPYQLNALVEGVSDLRPRMATISANTQILAEQLRQQLATRGHDLTLYEMSQEQIDAGLHSGVLSFYLPAVPTTYPDLVDEFVAWLLEHAPGLVKNRVSYGQSTGNGQLDPFYVINPEESTQGALSAEVKEAQKRGGVQICRISVPQHADIDGLVRVMSGFFDKAYGTPSA